MLRCWSQLMRELAYTCKRKRLQIIDNKICYSFIQLNLDFIEKEITIYDSLFTHEKCL